MEEKTTDYFAYHFASHISDVHQIQTHGHNLKHKTVPIYTIPSSGECYPVSILDLHLSKVREEAITVDTAFYLRKYQMTQWFTIR